MYHYYSTNKIKQLHLENSNNSSSSGINMTAGSGVPTTSTSPSTPIPNKINLNSNNRHSGFNNNKLYETSTSSTATVNQNGTQDYYSSSPMLNVNNSNVIINSNNIFVKKKPSKYKVSFSIKNTKDNLSSFEDKHCFGINSLAYDFKKDILYSAGRDSTIKSYYIYNSNNNSDNEQEEEQEENGDSVLIKDQQYKFKKSYEDHTDWVNDLFLREDDGIMVSCSSDSTIKIWDTENEKSIRSFKFHDDYVKVLAYSQGSNHFASSGLDSHINIWDLNTCSMVQTFSINNNSGNSSNDINSMDNIDEFTPPSSLLNNNNMNNNLNYLNKSYLYGKSGGEGISIYSLAISHDSSFVLSGSTERAIRGWDARSGQKEFKLKGHTDNIRSIILNQDSKLCLSAGSDSTVRLWDIGERKCIQVFDDIHSDSVWSLAASPNFSHFFSGDRDGMIVLTDLKSNQSKQIIKENYPILKILNNPNDQSIWVSTFNSNIKNYNLSNFYNKSSNLKSIKDNQDDEVNSDNSGDNEEDEEPIILLQNNHNDNSVNNNQNIISKNNNDNQNHNNIQPNIIIRGKSGIIKHQVLNNRRQILTKDNDNNVQLWDITLAKEIESFGKVDFDKKLLEINEKISIPKWFEVDTKTGCLNITLESSICFNAHAHLSNLEFIENKDYLINIGGSMLHTLFSKWKTERYNSYCNNQLDNSNKLQDSNDSVNSLTSSNSNSTDNQDNSNNNRNNQQSQPQMKSASQILNNNNIKIFPLPKNTDVVVYDETNSLVLYKSKIDEFTGKENLGMIDWLSKCLTSSQVQNKEKAYLVDFTLERIDQDFTFTPQLSSLHAPYYSPIKNISSYIWEKIAAKHFDTKSPPPSDGYFEILLQNEEMKPTYTIASIKSFYWKQNTSVELKYRVKQKYRNELLQVYKK